MLTREEFQDFYNNDRDKLNATFTAATPGEQEQYLKWLDEINPAEPEVDERDILSKAGEILQDTAELEAEIHARQTAAEDIEAQIHAERPITPAASRQGIMARQRAYRSNMLRKLKRSFRLMQPFDSQLAALEIGVAVESVARYLATESHVVGGQIGYNPELKKYFITDPLM